MNSYIPLEDIWEEKQKKKSLINFQIINRFKLQL